ncbi:MAG TPA: serine hydrolase domain-containing protein [Candidatus Nitrosocosmicus sp.]|nr:serine hydrolase domain-containing protein [Candidatus Nitrosocosmicus sp.]
MSTLIMLSLVTSSKTFQNQFQEANSQHTQIFLSNNSQYHSKSDISQILLEKFKEIVYDKPLPNNSSFSNNGIKSDWGNSIPIVVGIVSPNGTQVSGYGNISKINSTVVDGNTVFDIASISKTFVAIILADMVNQGLVDLNDPIETYLPADKIIVPSFNGNKITLEHLATHTSGLPDFPTGWIRNHSYTTQQVYDFVSNATLSSKPGTKANYSDIGMGILGHLLSLKADVSFDQLVEDRILKVLAMNSTGMRMNTTAVSVPEEIKSRYAQGHITGKEVSLEFVPETIQSAGAMYSTANDLLKYLSANIGLMQTKLKIPIEDTHLIRHSFGQSSENKSLKDYIGLGWTVTTDFGREVIWHTGSIDGYTSVIGFNPTKQIGLIILCGCNYDDYSLQDMVNLVIPFLIHYR